MKRLLRNPSRSSQFFITLTLLFVITFGICSCREKSSQSKEDTSESQSATEGNVLKEYIEVPKDKAKDVKHQLENVQNQRDAEAKKLLDD